MDQSQIQRMPTGKFTIKQVEGQGEGPGNVSRVTNINNSSNFIDDNTRLMELLASNCLENQNNHFYQEIDMGQIDDEDKPYMMVDKDTGKVYDLRNEVHV